MPPAYNAVDDLDGITAAMFAHLNRCVKYSFDACNTPENGFGFPQDAPTLWVKFGPDAPTMLKESRVHSYLHDHLPSLSGCQVPRIHRVYQLPDKTNGQLTWTCLEDTPWGIIVMDYVKGTRLKDLSIHKQDPVFQETLALRIATILTTMSSMRPPPGTAPGPGDGGRMSSPVWGRDDFDAPRGFGTVRELQDYIHEFIKDTPHEETADFSNEPFCLCYGDFNEGNFMLEDSADPHSALTVIDFEHTNWLPISFLFWEVTDRDVYDGPFYHRLATAIRGLLPVAPNMDNLQAIQSLRWKRGRQGN